MKLVTQGLKITTQCRYVKFSIDKYLDIFEDGESSCLYIKFPKKFNTKELIDNRIEVLKSTELQETDYIKLSNPTVDLNGLRFTKLTINDYIINQYIVKDIVNFIMTFDEHHCEILIPKSLDYRLDKYLKLIECNPYLQILDSKQLQSLNNFYSINIGNKSISIKSSNRFEFNTKKKYTKYLLDPINVQESFIDKLRVLLTNYGVELISLPIDQNTHSVHRVTYRFTEIGKQLSHKSDSNPLRYALQHSSHIEFKLSSPDLILFNDFRTKYQNLDLVSNFTEFYTNDKLGRNWKSNIVWSSIGTDFNQDYAQDELNSISFETGFSADLNYYVVYDEMYYNIQEIILSILQVDSESTQPYEIIKI